MWSPNYLPLLLSLLTLTRQDELADSTLPSKFIEDMRYILNNGYSMPMVGFGTYQVQGAELIKSTLDYALAAGYRLIDSATVYRNEEDIGNALKELLPKYNLSREDIFITSKLAPNDQGEKAYEALERSLKKLDCGYIDLYLIHWPGSFAVNSSDVKNKNLRDESWKQLAKGVKSGLVKSIGVSNYNTRQLRELLDNNHGVKPTVNQVEWHPNYHQKELLDLCNKENILLQAYSSLGGTGNQNLLNNPTVKEIAAKLGKSPAQILLRWPLQHNVAIIPKARSKQHINENIQLNFVIPEADMNILDHFNQTKYAWNPDVVA